MILHAFHEQGVTVLFPHRPVPGLLRAYIRFTSISELHPIYFRFATLLNSFPARLRLLKTPAGSFEILYALPTTADTFEAFSMKDFLFERDDGFEPLAPFHSRSLQL